jgi:hypothetical protein
MQGKKCSKVHITAYESHPITGLDRPIGFQEVEALKTL